MRPASADRRYWFQFICSSFVLVLGIWCSSGTLAPYAATHYQPTILEPCKYLANIDHGNFLGTYLFLDGSPRQGWIWSVYLRRILYPLLSFPFMKLFGFMAGGLLATITIHLISFSVFVKWIARRVGSSGAIAAMWLLASYPGIAYWAGLPYNQAMIVPCSLLIVPLLEFIINTDVWPRVFCAALLVGILCLGYDLMPFFGLAALLLVIFYRKRGWLAAPFVLATMAIPLVVVLLVEYYVYAIPLSNNNNDQYGVLLSAYLSPGDLHAWWVVVSDLPSIAWHVYLYSNFVFLPVLFGFVFAIGRANGVRLSPVELTVGASVILVFLFNNLAPPYQGWQMRGIWIPRIYQPVFVVFVTYIARIVASAHIGQRIKPLVLLSVACAVLGNGLVVFGPVVTRSAVADHTYYNFYRHSYPGIFTKNLETYGRRPLGFCTK